MLILNIVLVYTLPQRKIMEDLKLHWVACSSCDVIYLFNSSTTNSYHSQEESSPLSSQEGEKQTSSNFSSSYILKCPLYITLHTAFLCVH